MEFSKIFTHGCLVDLNVSMWTAKKKLDAEDLGIEDTEVSAAFSLGNKMLIPYEVIHELKSLENAARHILIQFSFPCEFGNARFVPKKRFVEFSGVMDAIIKKFNYKADDLARNYLTYRIDMREEYLLAAGEAYDRAKALNPEFDLPRDTFINTFLERIEKAYPEEADIRAKFRMEYIVFQVALPDISQASYGDLIEDSEKIKLMEQAYRTSLNRKVESFFEKITGDLRGKASATLKRFLDRLNGNFDIRSSSIESVINMIDEYEKMNFIGDNTFLKHLQMFRIKCLNYNSKMLSSDKVVRETVKRELKAIIEIATDQASINELVLRYKQGIDIL
jgi:rRNA-processing protein FCF1